LWDKEEEVGSRLERELEVLSSHETDLDTIEATLGVDRKSLEELCAEVLGHELTVDFRENSLNFKVEELADREIRLVERQPQELVLCLGLAMLDRDCADAPRLQSPSLQGTNTGGQRRAPAA
jgi:hypothetical protein